MRELFTTRSSLRLMDLCIPGTHDSGTRELDSNSPYAKDIDKTLYGLAETANGVTCKSLGWTGGVDCEGTKIIAKWARAQEERMREQLTRGYRYFDLRITQRGDGKFAFVHSLINADKDQQLSDELGTLRGFLDEHPREIVILDFQHIVNFNEQKYWSQLDALIQRHLGPKLLKPSELPGTPEEKVRALTLEALWSRGKQVIVLVKTRAAASGDKDQYKWETVAAGPAFTGSGAYFVRGDYLTSAWPNTDSYSAMIRFLKDGPQGIANAPRGSKLFVSQMILTPQTETILKDLGTMSLSPPGSLLELAKQLNEHQVSDIRELDQIARQRLGSDGKPTRVNIVITDSVKTSGVWLGCMRVNQSL
jgi:hypothetical protein